MFYTPLRYPGGKGQLAPFVKLLFQYNDLLDGHYVEPFAGGAGVALSMLFQECASHIHINDLSRPVYAFWHSVLNSTEALCTLIQQTEVTVEQRLQQKAVQLQPHDVSLLDLGFSTFFLNRTNRSGILTGGVIGGKDQTGKWKIDARYNREDLIQRIKKIALYRNRITIYNQDAADLIREVLPTLPQKSLVYLDPPYYVKGQDLYQNYYKHDDHAAIAKLVTEIPQRWMVSYDNRPEVAELYKGYPTLAYDYYYSAADRYQGTEVLFFSQDLILPPVSNPGDLKKTRRVRPAQEWSQHSLVHTGQER